MYFFCENQKLISSLSGQAGANGQIAKLLLSASQGPPVKVPASFRPGDWICPKCKAHNYKSKDKCFKCSEPKPINAEKDSLALVGGVPPNFRVGDWLCDNCNAHNYASKNRCYKCNALKPELKLIEQMEGNASKKQKVTQAVMINDDEDNEGDEKVDEKDEKGDGKKTEGEDEKTEGNSDKKAEGNDDKKTEENGDKEIEGGKQDELTETGEGKKKEESEDKTEKKEA